MTKKQRYEAVLSYFRQEMPEADTELEFGSIFQLLVAVVLNGFIRKWIDDWRISLFPSVKAPGEPVAAV